MFMDELCQKVKKIKKKKAGLFRQNCWHEFVPLHSIILTIIYREFFQNYMFFNKNLLLKRKKGNIDIERLDLFSIF